LSVIIDARLLTRVARPEGSAVSAPSSGGSEPVVAEDSGDAKRDVNQFAAAVVSQVDSLPHQLVVGRESGLG